MQPIYEHRQFGAAMLWFLGIPTVGIALIAIFSGEPSVLVPGCIVAFLALTGAIFSRLTVVVDPEAVRFHFGLNTFRRSIPVRDITAVRVVRNPLWMGLGIHFFRGGILYNVSGLDGIELALNNGRLVRIGSDEPAALAQAIEAARRG